MYLWVTFTGRAAFILKRFQCSGCPTWGTGHVVLFGLETVEDGDQPRPDTEGQEEELNFLFRANQTYYKQTNFTKQRNNSKTTLHGLKDKRTEDLLLPLVHSGLMEDAGSQFEPIQRNFDGRQRTLPHDLLPSVLVEQSTAAHDTQEGHWHRKSNISQLHVSPQHSRYYIWDCWLYIISTLH